MRRRVPRTGCSVRRLAQRDDRGVIQPDRPLRNRHGLCPAGTEGEVGREFLEHRVALTPAADALLEVAPLEPDEVVDPEQTRGPRPHDSLRARVDLERADSRDVGVFWITAAIAHRDGCGAAEVRDRLPGESRYRSAVARGTGERKPHGPIVTCPDRAAIARSSHQRRWCVSDPHKARDLIVGLNESST